MRAKAEVGGGGHVGTHWLKGGLIRLVQTLPGKWEVGGCVGGRENDREEGEKGVESRGWTDDKDVGGGCCRGGLR